MKKEIGAAEKTKSQTGGAAAAQTETREFICVTCPVGCNLTVCLKDGRVDRVEGNACKRGLDYALTEVTAPKRMLTTTVRTQGGAVVPVKSSASLPKEKLFACMDEINAARPIAKLAAGDVVIQNILGLGVDIVATDDERGGI